MSDPSDAFRAITAEDMTMPPGWSVSSGQTFLYTKEEQTLVQQARTFAQREIAPTAAAAHRRVKELKATWEGRERRDRLRALAMAYLKTLAEAGSKMMASASSAAGILPNVVNVFGSNMTTELSLPEVAKPWCAASAMAAPWAPRIPCTSPIRRPSAASTTMRRFWRPMNRRWRGGSGTT